MPDLANLTSGADLPEEALLAAVVVDDAAAPDDEVRCIVPSESQLAFDPMSWDPVVRPEGFFYPKRDDEAVIGIPANGDPEILRWRPAPGRLPDAPLS